MKFIHKYDYLKNFEKKQGQIQKSLARGPNVHLFVTPSHVFNASWSRGDAFGKPSLFYKVSKYQMKGVHNHPMTALSVLKHSSVADPEEGPRWSYPRYVYTKLRPEGLKKNFLGKPPPPPPPSSISGSGWPGHPLSEGLDLPLLIRMASIRGNPWTLPPRSTTDWLLSHEPSQLNPDK